MALEKNKTKAGNIFSYWRIGKISFDDFTNRIRISIYGYKDRSTRLNSINDSLPSIEMVAPFSVVTDWNQNPKKIGYQVLKRSILDENNQEQNFWNDALDVLE